MSNIATHQEIKEMAKTCFASGMFGLKNPEQVATLMLVAQAENIHPVKALMSYSVINGTPALKATEVQARFQRDGGVIEWIETSKEVAICTLTHPSYNGVYRSEYNITDAKLAGLDSKDNWKRMPKEMLRARAVSSGVRAVAPSCLNNMYDDNEARDFTETQATPEVIDVVEGRDFIEAVEVAIDTNKRILANILKKEGYTNAMITEFANKFELSNNEDLVKELVNSDIIFNEKLKEFENDN